MSNRQPSKVVFVGNIPYGLSEEQIQDIFSSAGRVLNFRLVYDRENGRPKGFGFAEYPDSDSAASAVRNLNDYEIMGRKLRVDFSNEGGSGGDDNNGSNNNDHAHGQHQNGTAPAASVSLPPLPPGRDLPPGATATDEISRILRTIPPTQLLDFLSQFKTMAGQDPARATELLAQAPQLAYAITQALLLMELVSPEDISAVTVPAPVQAQLPGYPYLGGGVSTHTPPVAAPAAYAPPPAAPVVPPQPDALIQQVLSLPQATVDQLPEAERAQIMAIRSQYGGGQR